MTCHRKGGVCGLREGLAIIPTRNTKPPPESGVITVTTIIKIIVTIILAFDSKIFTVINAGVGVGSGYILSQPLSESGGLKPVSLVAFSFFPFTKGGLATLRSTCQTAPTKYLSLCTIQRWWATHGLWVVLSGQGRPPPRPHVHGALLLSPGPGWYRWLKAPPELCWVSPQQVLKDYGIACTLGDPGLCTWRWRSRAPAQWGWWRKTGGKVLKTKTEQKGDWAENRSCHWQVNDVWAGRSCLLQEHTTWWSSCSSWRTVNVLLNWLCLIDSLCLFLGAVANERNI